MRLWFRWTLFPRSPSPFTVPHWVEILVGCFVISALGLTGKGVRGTAFFGLSIGLSGKPHNLTGVSPVL